MQNQTKPLKIKLLSEPNEKPSTHEKENSENFHILENTSSTELKLSEIYEKIENQKIKEAFLLYNQRFIFIFFFKISFFLSLVLTSWCNKLQEKTLSDLFSRSFSHLNFMALDFLENSELEICRKILWKCDEILKIDAFHQFYDLKILVFNNIGCYYRSIDKLFESLMYFQKSLSFVENGLGTKYSSSTYLNMSIILSQQNRYL